MGGTKRKKPPVGHHGPVIGENLEVAALQQSIKLFFKILKNMKKQSKQGRMIEIGSNPCAIGLSPNLPNVQQRKVELYQLPRNRKMIELFLPSTLDFNYSGITVKFIQLYMAAHKIKDNNKLASHVHIRKFHDSILFGAQKKKRYCQPRLYLG